MKDGSCGLSIWMFVSLKWEVLVDTWITIIKSSYLTFLLTYLGSVCTPIYLMNKKSRNGQENPSTSTAFSWVLSPKSLTGHLKTIYCNMRWTERLIATLLMNGNKNLSSTIQCFLYSPVSLNWPPFYDAGL